MKIKKVLIFFIVCLFVSGMTMAQNRQLDSLLKCLSITKADTNKLRILNELGRKLIDLGKYDSAKSYTNEALMLSEKLHAEKVDINYRLVINKNRAKAYNSIGLINWRQGNYQEAINNHLLALKLRKDIADKPGIAASYNNIATVYLYQGNYPEALKNLLAALKIKEELGDKKSIAASYIGIGNVYYSQANYPEALKNYTASLKIKEEIGDKKGMAPARMGMGIVYFQQGNYVEALKNYMAALKIEEEVHNKNGIASAYVNIGEVYYKQERYEEALKSLFASLKIMEEMGDKDGIANCYISIGSAYVKQNDLKQAFTYLNRGTKLANEIGSVESIKAGYEGLTEAFEKAKNYEKAHEYYKQYIIYRDSLINEENTKKTVQAQMQFDFDKTVAVQKAEQAQKDAVLRAEALKQRLIRNVFIGGFILMLFLAYYIYRGYKNKQKANDIITAQKLEVEQQKELVDEKNREITDSINYAKRIQSAILPSIDVLNGHFTDSFIYYKPKDIVSGDFYSFIKRDNTIVIAVADCTGHGVPGALMSMVGSNILNQIVLERKVTNPSEILRRLNVGIIRFLKQAENKTLDGMDIAVCVIDLEILQLEFAGANRPMLVVKNIEASANNHMLHEIKPDKQPIGGYYDNVAHSFTSHILQLQRGDVLYLYSDGYADQFGGKDGKKLMTKQFKELLVGMKSLTMGEQENKLNSAFEEWKGLHDQVDDVLVVGVKV